MEQMHPNTAQMTCPHCGSHKVRIINNEPLYIPDPHTANHESELYQFDEEIYALVVCDVCKQTIHIQGTISWNVINKLK